MSQLNQLNDVRLYNVGGAGIGVGKYFEADRNQVTDGFAKLHPVYMDTSKASTFGVPEEFFYHLPGAIGSGGVRAYNGPDIIRYTGEMLQAFPPMETNIIIHSTTGGSGSIMGPSIASELLAQGKNVIVFAIGSDDTLNYINNTIGTLDSYENIARIREAGVPLRFLQNGTDGTVEEVDKMIRQDISSLAVLYSGQNKNLDMRDLFNWTHFSNVTSYQPQVAVLSIHRGNVTLAKDTNLITVATLNSDLNNTKLDYPVEFQRVGVPQAENVSESNLKYPLHFVITDGYLDTVMKSLRNQKADFETKASARVVRNQLSDGKKPVQSNGIVF